MPGEDDFKDTDEGAEEKEPDFENLDEDEDADPDFGPGEDEGVYD